MTELDEEPLRDRPAGGGCWALTLLFMVGLALVLAYRSGAFRTARKPGTEPVARSGPQSRDHGKPVTVDPATITVDDGDTVLIRWPGGDSETVRILGIDTPEVRHDEHDIPEDQDFGQEARGFARGAFATATEIRLLRASKLDPYGRTLGYLFLNGRNYSVLILRARLSDETVSHYGDNGLPYPAAEVTAAARGLPSLRFEPPHVFRKRMRERSVQRKANRREP